MNGHRLIRTLGVFALLALSYLAGGGCAVMNADLAMAPPDFPEADQAPQPGMPAPPTATRVVIQRYGAKPKLIDVPLAEAATVQEALEFAKVTRPFQKIDVIVYRPNPDPSQPMQRMACDYSGGSRSVSIETDYGLRPGDRIVVSEDDNSILNRLLGGLGAG